MKYFFDTSALVKLFQVEKGSEIVEEIVNDPDNDLWVLDLVRIEFLSSIYRQSWKLSLNPSMNSSSNLTRNYWVLLYFMKLNNL